jgi:predicted HTH transcriptional regulator
MESWQWIFIFFAVLMVARIVPRMLRKGKMNVQRGNVVATEQPSSETRDQPFVKESKERSFVEEAKPESKEMMVLGQINRGYKTFSEIRKKTGFGSEDLNSILEDLEKRGLMKMQKKNGLLGIKVELLPTEKGYLEFDS